MPALATLAAEPADKRTSAWKDWAATVPSVSEDPEPQTGHAMQEWKDWASRHYARGWVKEQAEKAALAVKATEVAVAVAATPATEIPKDQRIMTPDEWVIPFLTNNPAAVSQFNREPNPIAAMASACLAAYESYLILMSPQYRAHYQATHPDARFLPKPDVLWAEYRAATKV